MKINRDTLIFQVQEDKFFRTQIELFVWFARLLIIAVIYIGDCIKEK